MSESNDPALGGIPAEYRTAAMHVCQHLVMLRGGAIFLSSADALRLMKWLDQAVPTHRILTALEMAAARRVASRSRIPLSLGQASRYLKKAQQAERSSGDRLDDRDALRPLVRELVERAEGDPAEGAMRALAADLAAVAEPRRDVDQVIQRIGRFHRDVWESQGAAGQREARERAAEALVDLRDLVDEAVWESMLDEHARYAVRTRYAWLCADRVWEGRPDGEKT